MMKFDNICAIDSKKKCIEMIELCLILWLAMYIYLVQA